MFKSHILKIFTTLALLVGNLMFGGHAHAGCADANRYKPDSISPDSIIVAAGSTLAQTFTVGSVKGGGAVTDSYTFTVKANPDQARATYTHTGTTGAFVFTGVAAGNTSIKIEMESEQHPGCKKKKTVNIAVTSFATVCTTPTLSAFPTYTTNMNTALSEVAANIASHVNTNGGTSPLQYSNTITTGVLDAGGLSAFDANTGAFTYQPLIVPAPANWVGTYTFDLTVAPTCDLTKTATRPITISVVDPGAGGACAAPNPSTLGTITLSSGNSYTGTPSTSGGNPPYVYSIAAAPSHGTLVLNNTVTGNYTYTATPGYSGADAFTLNVASGACPSLTASKSATVSVSNNATGTYSAAPGTGNLIADGAIIIDNTSNPGSPGITTNMNTNLGGKQFGVANAFNINSIQVMQRDTSVSPHNLKDEAGHANANSTSYANYGTSKQTNYFADGQHLFDLDRLRAAADWLSANVIATTGTCTLPGSVTAPTLSANTHDEAGPTVPMPQPEPFSGHAGSCHPAGTYGTISWHQFLDNIANNRTMYGIVRVLVPLKLGTSASSNNALNVTVGNSQIYGFCNDTVELCANAPTGSTNIKPGGALRGNVNPAVTIPANGQIRMRGVLMLDFVNGAGDAVYPVAGTPIGLDHLPFQPRDIYFKVSVPINVNAAHDLDGDGVMDNMDYINGLTSGITCPAFPCTTIIPNTTTIDSTKVPAEAVAAWNYQFGTSFTGPTDATFVSSFNATNKPNQYHLMMASGYAQGLADAFAELNITAQQWNDLGFTVPPGADMNQTLKVHDIRNNAFEDLPVYLYTGGLVDMHHHLNVSGLLYVPQAMELEAKQATSRQYVFGGIVVRDGFYIESKAGSVTLVSSDPASFSGIKVNAAAVTGAMMTAAISNKHDDGAGGTYIGGVGLGSGTGNTYGGGEGDNSVAGGGGSFAAVGKIRWIEVRPH